MTDAQVAALRELARDGCIGCGQVFAFAAKHHIELPTIKIVLAKAGLRVKDCEQPCLSLRCKHYR